MPIKLSLFIVLLLPLSGLCDEAPKVSSLVSMKERWTLGVQTLVKEAIKKIEIDETSTAVDNEKLFKIFVELVASDMSFYYVGECSIITAENVRLAGYIKSQNYLKQHRFEDPFLALEGFKRQPDAPQTRIHIANQVLTDKKSYERFREWFAKSIDSGKVLSISR